MLAVIKFGNKQGKGVIGFVEGSVSTESKITSGVCIFQPTGLAPDYITGRIEFEENITTGKTRIIGYISGIKDYLSHGFHIHSFGDLSSISDGMSVGPHFNPYSTNHSIPGGSVQHHVGDLGNIAYYDNNHNAWYKDSFHNIPISKNKTASILGRALVLHSLFDNGCEQPTGGSGSRWAFCVIGALTTPTILRPPFEIPPQKGPYDCNLIYSYDEALSYSSLLITVIVIIILVFLLAFASIIWWKKKNSTSIPWHSVKNDES